VTDYRKTTVIDRIKRAALDFDARFGHALYATWAKTKDSYARYSLLMEKLSLSGPSKWIVTVLGEGLTMGAAGSILLLALAVPAFRETQDENWLKKQDLAVTFLDRYGTEMARRGIKHDDSARIEDMPDYFIKAVLATEDRRFFEHYGIDIVGTIRALTVNARSSTVVQGGSSITQQLAKNLFLNNERSIERKVKEAYLAMWLESRLTKTEILKLYLDRVYMGAGTFGAAAAAEYYFGKSIRDVSLSEAAMLAGLFKAPTKYAPHINLPAARARAIDVLSNLVEAGYLNESQILPSRRNPATPISRERDVTADYYLDWAFVEAKRLSDAGKFGEDRVLTIKTALDIDIQRRAESVIDTMLRQHGNDYDADQGAAVVMDVDGAVRSIVGGRDYGTSQFNRATDGLRQPGSAFKPFVYGAALNLGRLNRNSNVVDRGVCIGNWCPQNYNRSFAGSMPLTAAVARSINSIPVALTITMGQDRHPTHVGRAARLGRDRVVGFMRDMGITTEMKDTPSMPIGSVEISVLDMAAGYSAFANAGRKSAPYAIMEAYNSRGELVYRRDRDGPRAEQIMSRQVAEDMNWLLSKVPEEGTGRRAALPGIRSAGKTGTTSAYRDAWYVGYTGNLTTAVWFGNDDFSPMADMTGGTLPAMAWHEIMTYAHQGQELRAIPGVLPMDATTPAKTPAAVANRAPGFEIVTPTRPQQLSRKASQTLQNIDGQMRSLRDRRAGQSERRVDGDAGGRENRADVTVSPRVEAR
jgi:penicillin-binding protein 1A